MANNRMLTGVTDFYDDFSGPFSSATSGLLASKCNYALGTGTNTVTRLAINGSAARMLGDTNEAADMVLSGPRAFEVDECGLLTLQARIRINTQIESSAVFIGFWDIITTGQLSYEDAAVVSTPADGFGVVYEGEQATPFLYTIGVGNDVDDTVRLANNIDALAEATWFTVKIEADNNNDATTGVVRYRVWIDGKLMKTAVTDANGWTTSVCRSSIVLAPVIARAGRAIAYSVDVCEFAANGGKGTTLD